jgi:hypothetical protein
MDCITILYALAFINLFTNVGRRPFPGKRPIYPQYGDDAPSSDDPKDLPDSFLHVLMNFDGNNFVSIDGSQMLRVNLPTEGEESVHHFEGLDFYEGENYYFFFTKAELTEAGFEISRKPGFNFWNAEAIRWEPRGHVVENSWADRRFYVVPDGYVAVCYQLSDDGSVKSQHPGLPVFKQDDFSSAWCFQDFFGHHLYDQRRDFGLAYFFIEFSLEELSNAGVEVPADLTGYWFNPDSAIFEEVEKPATPCGWDWITQCWRPICNEKDEEEHQCCSGKPAFPWESSMSNWILGKYNDVFTYLTNNTDEARRNASLMQNFFSRNGGPYCDCKCFCSNCRRFHFPWDGKKHRPYEVTSKYNERSEWTCDDF